MISCAGQRQKGFAAVARTPAVCPPEARRHVLVSAILASSLAFIDGSVVAVALPAIQRDLAASFVALQWVANGYVLTLSAFMLVGGAAGDRFGRRDVFMVGIAAFVGASALCALAPSAGWLVAARLVQGLGAACMVPGSLALISASFPRQERGAAIGWWSAASAMSAAVGPVLGGLLISAGEAWAWRLIFLINLPLGGLALWLLYARVPQDAPARRAGLDWPGAALAVAGLGCLALALTRLTEGAQGFDMLNLVLFAAGPFFMLAFVLHERRAPWPMVPLHIFRSGVFSGANLLTFIIYFALAGVLFFLPMTLIEARSYSEALAGAVFGPFTLLVALLSRFAGRVADSQGPRLLLTLGTLIVAAAFAFLGFAVESAALAADFWQAVFPAMLLLGLGMGLIAAPISTAVMTALNDENAGAASSINNAIARMAGLFAVAALGPLAALAFRFEMAGFASDSSGYAGGFGERPAALTQAGQQAYAEAMASGFATVAHVCAGLCLLGAAVAFLTQRGDIRPRFGRGTTRPAEGRSR